MLYSRRAKQLSVHCGFTLLEILVTTVMSLLLLGAAIASYQSLSQRQVKVEAGRDLMAVLRDVQSRARDGNKPPENCSQLNGYRIWAVENTGAYFIAVRCDEVQDNLEQERRELSGGAIFMDGFELYYSPLPGPVGGAPVTIRIAQLTDMDDWFAFDVSNQGVITSRGILSE